MAKDDSQQTMKVMCKYKASTDAFEADVVPDIRCNEVVMGLIQDGYLGALRPGERYGVIVRRTDHDLSPSEMLTEAGVVGGDVLDIFLESHGAGPSPVELAEVLAAAKVAIDAAQVVVDAYRARTERLSVELKRAELEAQAHRDQIGAKGSTKKTTEPEE
jgi:hypothetical protein